MELPSKFQIDDNVSFYPMYRHETAMGVSEDKMEGRVVAIRFTQAKVFYDIVDDYYGKIFDNVDSVKVGASMWAKKNEDVPSQV